jgi:hypothetical protein
MAELNHPLELLSIRVTPEDDPNEVGILLDGTISLPFTIERDWSGNMGYYFEQYAITAGEREVYRSVPQQIFVRGLQSRTAYRNTVDERVQLEPGTCELLFIIDDVPMAKVEVPVKALSRA